MKKILVIEDQYGSMKMAFELANFRKYDGKLEIKTVPRSQDVDYSGLEEYGVIFVDLTLARLSEMNGYGVIKKILDENLYPKERLVIMSVNEYAKEGLQQNGLPTDIETIVKPVTFKFLEEFLPRYISVEE